jgi:hypothetical protein
MISGEIAQKPANITCGLPCVNALKWNKKSATHESRAKSTPKEEGGGDTGARQPIDWRQKHESIIDHGNKVRKVFLRRTSLAKPLKSGKTEQKTKPNK